MKRTLIVLLTVAFLAGGCSKSDDSTKPANSPVAPTGPSTSAVVVAGEDTAVGVAGVTVTVPDGAATPGSKLNLTVSDDSSDTGDILGPIVDIDLEGDLLGPATISMPFDPAALPAQGDPWLYTWVEESERWLPQAARVEGDQLVAETMHFSWWSWGSPFYQWGKVTGDRTTPPDCNDGLPSWAVGDLITVDDPNTTVFVCTETAGDLVRVKLKANRGDPILIEFSHDPTIVGGSEQSKLLTQVLQERWPRRAFIEARQELVVTFTRPARAGVISAKRWGGDGARYLIAGFTLFVENVLGGAPGKLPQMYRAAKCLFDSGQFAAGDDDVFKGVGTSTGMLSSCLEDQLESFRAGGIIDGSQFTRLNQAFALWKYADTLTKAMDVVLIDGDDRFDYFGIQTRSASKPQTPPPPTARPSTPQEVALTYVRNTVLGQPVDDLIDPIAPPLGDRLLSGPDVNTTGLTAWLVEDSDWMFIWGDTALPHADGACADVGDISTACVVQYSLPAMDSSDGQTVLVLISGTGTVAETRVLAG